MQKNLNSIFKEGFNPPRIDLHSLHTQRMCLGGYCSSAVAAASHSVRLQMLQNQNLLQAWVSQKRRPASSACPAKSADTSSCSRSNHRNRDLFEGPDVMAEISSCSEPRHSGGFQYLSSMKVVGPGALPASALGEHRIPPAATSLLAPSMIPKGRINSNGEEDSHICAYHRFLLKKNLYQLFYERENVQYFVDKVYSKRLGFGINLWL